MTASIDVAQYQSGESGANLVRRVDTALYEAKNTGKYCVVLVHLAYFSREQAWTALQKRTARMNPGGRLGGVG